MVLAGIAQETIDDHTFADDHATTGSEVVKLLFFFTLFHQKDHQILPHLSWCAPQGCRVGGFDRTPKKHVVIRWGHHFLDQQGKIHHQAENRLLAENSK